MFIVGIHQRHLAASLINLSASGPAVPTALESVHSRSVIT